MDELYFRALFAVIFLTYLSVRWFFHWRRGILCKNPKSEKEGKATNFAKFLIIAVTIGACLLWAIKPEYIQWAAIPLPGVLRTLGASVAIVGLPLYLFSFLSLGKQYSSTLKLNSGHRLISGGPYRYIRHPMYAASMLGFGGLSFLSANAMIAGCFLTILLVVIVIRIRIEEEQLLELFGDQYEDYMGRTGRYFPRLSREK